MLEWLKELDYECHCDNPVMVILMVVSQEKQPMVLKSGKCSGWQEDKMSQAVG
jgi:hypothetical protein